MKPNKVLITGSNGQLGRELARQCKDRGIEYAGYDIPELDISDKNSIREILDKEKPDAVINCGAITNVDGCEEQLELAQKVNADAPGFLAHETNERGIPIVQVSTDYVFDGEGIRENGELRPYVESDSVDPQSAYGSTKEAGERNVMNETDQYYIIRTAWLYGDGNNFVRTMLKLADKYPQVTVVNDQMGSPTYTQDLASAILDLLETEEYGIYHGTAEGSCAWSDFAAEIFRQAGRDTKVIPVTSEEYAANAGKTVAKRPPYSVLENKHLKELGIGAFRPWKEELTSYLKAEGIL
ncbi:MAG: dTDP-4-dehydrorhamnose reductase [Eubacteriaceae bacterium]|jgi:dTDP-4-dehydrorhamnose reductase